MPEENSPLPAFIQRFLAIHPGGASHAGALLICMIGVLAGCAWMLGGFTMIVSAALAVAMMLLFSPMVSPEFVMKLLRAKPLDPHFYEATHEMVGLLCDRAGLAERPKLFVLPGKGVNAITTGTEKGTSIAISNDAS